ncbi:tyrosinase family oxidase copper chaperone [Streptomyces sp. NPDC020298]|uniref:tyrosinase family oxidase copper chaperone n=1 Tax=unclassified Streptomyces TaxID=2593676 RepID=UPI0033E12DD2
MVVSSTRRDATRGLLACALGTALAPVVVAEWPSRREPGSGRAPSGRAPSGSAPDGTGFTETYRGRGIQGTWTPADGPAGDGHWRVTVDGRPLHLMRRADGTWLSMVDHYRPYRTPLEAARAAVDELGLGERLRDLAPGPVDAGHSHMGGRHDVRA